MENSRGSFGSKLGVILATAGSAVGLGNIWRFPLYDRAEFWWRSLHSYLSGVYLYVGHSRHGG